MKTATSAAPVRWESRKYINACGHTMDVRGVKKIDKIKKKFKMICDFCDIFVTLFMMPGRMKPPSTTSAYRRSVGNIKIVICPEAVRTVKCKPIPSGLNVLM